MSWPLQESPHQCAVPSCLKVECAQPHNGDIERRDALRVAQTGRLDDEAQAFSRAVLGVSSLQGTVRVSAPPVLAEHFLVPRLAAIRILWQNIDLEVIGESRDANLARGEADLAIRMSRPTTLGLTARYIGDIGYGLYAAHGYTCRSVDDREFLGYDDSLVQVPQQCQLTNCWQSSFCLTQQTILYTFIV